MNPKKKAFLAAFAECGIVRLAAEAAEIGRRSHYDWLQNDPEYAEAFAESQELAIEKLEAEARRRALVGVSEPVIYQGRMCFEPARDKETGDILRNDEGDAILSETPLVLKKPSDVLMIFLLKSMRPERYRDNIKIEHTGALEVIAERLAAARTRVAQTSEEDSERP